MPILAPARTSLEHAGVGFTRDQLGRQSMSEKRHASKDAKSTDTYQRTKKAREEREQQRRQIEAELRLQEAEERRRAAGQLRRMDIIVVNLMGGSREDWQLIVSTESRIPGSCLNERTNERPNTSYGSCV